MSTWAVDREALARIIHQTHGCTCQEHPSVGVSADCDAWLKAQAEGVADTILASGILRDAAAVRHEHGERIAKDHDEQADEYERLGYLGEDIYRACARRARDLSPPLEEEP